MLLIRIEKWTENSERIALGIEDKLSCIVMLKLPTLACGGGLAFRDIVL
jgi:hypothetical protein